MRVVGVGRWRRRAARVAALLGVTAIAVAPTALELLLGVAPPAAAAGGTPLVGTFELTAGSCSGGVASGTYLRMVLSGGTNASGPYFSNSDSSCSDNTYTPLAPGTGGGLVTGSYQPEPSPAFDGSGNALADQITAPVPFEGVRFATSTNAIDPQTGLHAPAPSIDLNGTTLSGTLQSFGVSWNNQQFNQGSPKPDGSSPGNTTPVTGTYNPSTGAYVLQWSSQVVGGPFNGFSAFWHLTGRFVPASTTPAAAPAATPAPTGGAPAAASAPHSAAGAASGSSSGASSTPQVSVTAPATGTAAGATAPTTTSTPSGSAAAAPQAVTVLSSHTVSSGGGGWQSPTWLIALVAFIAVVGLAGVLASDRALRRVRSAATTS